jgi:glycolate oxidase
VTSPPVAEAPLPKGPLGSIAAELIARLGTDAVITDHQRLRTYECDGLAHLRAVPGLVVLAADADAVAATAKACAAAGVPFVARGSGTGLSGGALPRTDGVLIVCSQMRHVLEIDAANQRAVLQPGVINLDISRAAAPHRLQFAPDPSSQQVCSIGGNVAENSGGAHCLKYGFTTNHVTGLDVVTADGDRVRLGGGKTLEAPGYDLLGAFVGSEGTLGVATEVTVRLIPVPEDIRTLLVGFDGTDAAGAATSAIIGAGITPAAIEMMDALAIEAAEAAVGCGYPEGAGAVLVIELDGPATEVEAEGAAVEDLVRRHGAGEVRVAATAEERALIWRGRKSAFAAVGRISPDYIVQDGVIPRTALSEVLTKIADLAAASGVRVANVFHAGDGNLHPLVLFDESVAGEGDRAEELSAAILDICLEHGGSITGEHGVGVDKAKHMPRMFSDDDLDVMQQLRCAFDPDHRCNPGKVFPTPRLCGEVPGRRSGPHPLQEAGLGELF